MSANNDLDLLRRISAEWVTSKTLRQEAGHRLGVMVAIFEQLDDKAQRGELPDDWKASTSAIKASGCTCADMDDDLQAKGWTCYACHE